MSGIVRSVCVVTTSIGLLYAAPVSAGSLGSLTQLSGGDGCVDYAGFSGCTASSIGYEALRVAKAVAVTPDGEFAYAAAYEGDAIVAFDRDISTGALTPLEGANGCVKDSSHLATSCPTGVALASPTDVAVSPDGLNLYVTSEGSDAVAVLDITASGSLSQKTAPSGCWSSRASLYGAGTCQQATTHLVDPTSITSAPDGQYLYITDAEGVETFKRDTTTGELSQPWLIGRCLTSSGATPCRGASSIGSATDAAISPDGRYLHIVSEDTDAVTNVTVESDGRLTALSGVDECVSDTVPGCTSTVTATLDGPSGIAISPGGENLYVTAANSNAVSVLSVGSDGSVSQSESDPCEAEGSTAGCDTLPYGGMVAPERLAISSDGHSVYVVSPSSSGLTAFDRSSDGALTPLPEGEGCLMDQNVVTSPCTSVRGLVDVSNVAIAPNDDSVYATGSGALWHVQPSGGSVVNFAREQSSGADSLGETVDDTEGEATAVVDGQDEGVTTTTTSDAVAVNSSSATQAESSGTSTATTAAEATATVACAALTVVRQRRAQSAWRRVSGGTRVRLRVSSGGYLLRSASRGSVTLDARSTYGRKSTVRRVLFYVDSRRVTLDRRAPWNYSLRPGRYLVGKHTVTAKVYPRNGRMKVVTLKILVGQCEPARYTIYQSSLIRNAFANYRMSANGGDTELASLSATLPTISRTNRAGLRRSRGKKIGTLRLTRQNGRSLRYSLKLPRSGSSSTLTLLSRGEMRARLYLKRHRVSISGLPDGVTGLSIHLDNKKRRLFRNASFCGTLRYSATMISRLGDGLSFMRSRPQCASIR